MPDRSGGQRARLHREVRGAPLAAGLVVGVLAVSSSAVLVRLADAPSLALAFWRCALGALVLAPAALRWRHTRLDPSERGQLALAGLALAAHFALFISSLSFTTVASATLLVSMAPLFVGGGAALFLAEAPSRRMWTGIVAALVGAGVVAAADGLAGLEARALLGDALAFAGALLVSVYLLVGRSARRRLPLSLYAATVYAVAAVVLLPAALLTGTVLGGYSRGTWLAIGGLVLGPQLLGHTVFNGLLATVSATVVAVVVLAEPLGASALAWWVLGEVPDAGFWLGAPLVLAGVWLAASSPQPVPDAVGPDGEVVVPPDAP